MILAANRLKSLFFALIFPCCTLVFAQSEDLELWKSVAFEKRISKQVSLAFEEQIRLNNNVSQLKSTFIDAGVDYTPIRSFRLALGYRYVNRLRSTDQRLYTDFTLRTPQKYKVLEPSIRFRYQEDYERGELPERYFRPKISLKSAIQKLRLSLNGELFYHLSNEGNKFDRYRTAISLSRSISSQASLSLGYTFQQEFNVNNPLTSSILSVGFTVELQPLYSKKRQRLPRVKR